MHSCALNVTALTPSVSQLIGASLNWVQVSALWCIGEKADLAQFIVMIKARYPGLALDHVRLNVKILGGGVGLPSSQL